MSETPRTEIAIYQTDAAGHKVNASFARQLETELAYERSQEATVWCLKYRDALATAQVMREALQEVLPLVNHGPNPIHTAACPNCTKCKSIANAQKALSTPSPKMVRQEIAEGLARKLEDVWEDNGAALAAYRAEYPRD